MYLSVRRLVILPCLDPHESPALGAGREGAGLRTPAAEPGEGGGGMQRVFAALEPLHGKFTPPPSPKRASFLFEVLWLRPGLGGGKPSRPGHLIFTSRPLCCYFGRKGSCKVGVKSLLYYTTERAVVSHAVPTVRQRGLLNGTPLSVLL